MDNDDLKFWNSYNVFWIIFLSWAIGMVCFLAFAGCHNGTKENPNIPEMVARSTYDSLAKIDSALLVHCEMEAKRNDSVLADAEYLLRAYKIEEALNKKLKDSLFKQNWRIVKAKHYIKIVQKNPHNLGFLIGWLNNQCFN